MKKSFIILIVICSLLGIIGLLYKNDIIFNNKDTSKENNGEVIKPEENNNDDKSEESNNNENQETGELTYFNNLIVDLRPCTDRWKEDLMSFTDYMSDKGSTIIECDNLDKEYVSGDYSIGDICYKNDLLYKCEYDYENERCELSLTNLPIFSNIKQHYFYHEFDSRVVMDGIFLDINNDLYRYNGYSGKITPINTNNENIKKLEKIRFELFSASSYQTFLYETVDGKLYTLGLNDITNYDKYKLVREFRDEAVNYRAFLNNENNIMTYAFKDDATDNYEPYEFKDENGNNYVVQKLILKNEDVIMFIANNKVYISNINDKEIELYNAKTVKDTKSTYSDELSKNGFANARYCPIKTTSKFIIYYTDGTSEEFSVENISE